MEIIKRTAHTAGPGPNAASGYGIIDPLAALTYQLAPLKKMPNPQRGRPIAGPPLRDPGDGRARDIVLAVTGACAALSLVALAVLAPKRIRSMRPGG
jgi:membrane-anchored mycosin MYCP